MTIGSIDCWVVNDTLQIRHGLLHSAWVKPLQHGNWQWTRASAPAIKCSASTRADLRLSRAANYSSFNSLSSNTTIQLMMMMIIITLIMIILSLSTKDALFVLFWYSNSCSVYLNTIRYSFPSVTCNVCWTYSTANMSLSWCGFNCGRIRGA